MTMDASTPDETTFYSMIELDDVRPAPAHTTAAPPALAPVAPPPPALVGPASSVPTDFATVQTFVSTRPAVMPAPAQVTEPALRLGDIVAGAATEGSGRIVGFRGRGKLSRQDVLDTLRGADLPADWAPRPVTSHRLAARAVNQLNSSSLVARAQRDRTALRRAGQEPSWVGRWQVLQTGRGAVGDVAGTVILVAQLDAEGVLSVESTREDLAARVRQSYADSVANEIYDASDISDWLRSVLVARLGAARLGGTWFVRRQHAELAERLLTAFSAVWGEDYLLPALPVANSDQLRRGLAAGFASEVEDVLTEYREKSAEASTEGEKLSHKASIAIHAKLKALMERAVGFTALLGEEHTRTLRAQLVSASEEIEQTMDGISQRFGLIFDELARDAK